MWWRVRSYFFRTALWKTGTSSVGVSDPLSCQNIVTLETGRLRLGLEERWAGIGNISWKVFSTDRSNVHRIKVDEARELLITSVMIGGIRVVDLKTNKLLWGLDRVNFTSLLRI